MSSDDYNSASDIDDSIPTNANSSAGNKRKHTAGTEQPSDKLQQQVDINKLYKKKQKIHELKQRTKTKHKYDYELRDTDLIKLPPNQQCELYWKLYVYNMVQHKLQLSSIEQQNTLTTSNVVKLNINESHTLDKLNKLIKTQLFADYKSTLCSSVQSSIVHHSPYIVYICSNALRCVEVVRSLYTLGLHKSMIVKLFSKHIKIEEQIQLLDNDIRIVCGTPNRIHKLIDNNSLQLDRCRYIVCDMQRDSKNYTLFTLPDVSHEYFILYQKYLHELIMKPNNNNPHTTKLMFY